MTNARRPLGCLWGAYSTLAIILLNTLLLLLLAEVGARLLLALQPNADGEEQRIAAFKADMLRQHYYYSQAWAAAYWDEHFLVANTWAYAPYRLWQTRPFAGEYINVDSEGQRRVPDSDCQPNSYQIFAFGGSTMWGYGVPDWNTIPAYLQANLADLGVCVVNYGEVAYNSTQSLIRLIRLLQAGERPDMVIFYDGSNDLATANRTSEAGLHFYIEDIAPRVDAVARSSGPEPHLLAQWLRLSGLYRLLAETPPRPQPNWALPPLDEDFVDDVTTTYLENIRMAQAVAEAYDITFVAFIQPALPLVRGPLTDEMQRFLYDMPGGLPELFRVVYPRWQQAAEADDHLVYLGSLLDGMSPQPWIDFNHLNPWGNLAVAQAITDVVRPRIARQVSSSSNSPNEP
ncbi:MAG: GDSL-type esterase/lipase family protein [Anaerolineae bacterium]|nr:GDSL-type esterase/lipase family protein [Anaerolineae bacterium]MDW8173554.1 GDSL-type esterase/lipase family protein [Anaerolineae bacterium]